MGRHDDNDEPRGGDMPLEDFGTGPIDTKTGEPRAPQTDEELAREALAQFSVSGPDWFHERDVIAAACATARAQGRADALAPRGEASAGEAPATPAAPSAPATDDRTARDSDLERVAAALWRAWWRTHGESESEIRFAQLYEGARARWLEIAAAGFAAREAGQ